MREKHLKKSAFQTNQEQYRTFLQPFPDCLACYWRNHKTQHGKMETSCR